MDDRGKHAERKKSDREGHTDCMSPLTCISRTGESIETGSRLTAARVRERGGGRMGLDALRGMPFPFLVADIIWN